MIQAYDHIISVHEFNKFDNVMNDGKSQSFEKLSNNKHISAVQQYIVQQFGGFCPRKECPILCKHIMYRGEDGNVDKYDKQGGEMTNGAEEIKEETLNALHCYILHEKKQLFTIYYINY